MPGLQMSKYIASIEFYVRLDVVPSVAMFNWKIVNLKILSNQFQVFGNVFQSTNNRFESLSLKGYQKINDADLYKSNL